jgi:drug/metabolite transporter (DMT)-like permease
VMLVRGLFATALIAALVFHQRVMRPLRTILMRPVLVRVIGEVGGAVSFPAAITHLPLASTSAILQALPLLITLGAALARTR